MSWYYDFKPKPTIKSDKGIKAKSKRGAFVKSWWAGRWLKAMEQVMDRGRLGRGRRYARAGQVLSLGITPGQVVARVQGSRRAPYKVTIEIAPFDEGAWSLALDALAQRPFFVAQLLAGEMPAEIEEAFAAVYLSLFPGGSEISQDCSCPDWAAVCKHLAAVHYILAERFDEDPFLLFLLRGKTQEEIVAALGPDYVPEVDDTPAYQPAPPLAESLDDFWSAGPELDQFSVHITPPESPYPVLERLGPPDFLPEAGDWLRKAYDSMATTAIAIAFADATSEESETES